LKGHWAEIAMGMWWGFTLASVVNVDIDALSWSEIDSVAYYR
jgi:hypothetical protein